MNNLNNKKSWSKQIDKLLFLFASLYFMVILGWLWKNKQMLTTDNIDSNQTIPQQTVAPKQLLSNRLPDANQTNQNEAQELILSMPLPKIKEISNKTISSITTSNPQISSSNNLNNNISLPPLPPPPPNMIQQNPQPISSPSSPKKVVSSPKKLAKVPTINSLNDSATEKETEKINSLPLESESSVSSVQASTNIVNMDYTYSLVGVVQLPENGSFALFKINNLTEKIPVGSEIGTSGWVLMAVNGNQAVISRENQSVNIRVGETF